MAKTFRPKPLNQQVIVITGASSGIGLATAKMAAKKGAKVVLSSRNGQELKKWVEEIESDGGDAFFVVADVSKYEDLQMLRNEAIMRFGRIDTWINNAGTSIYGYLMDSDIREERELFETNFWGVRYGSRIAVEELSKKGGTLINLGSEVSVASQPLLGMYSATKHAVKAFTEALRSEIKDRGLPVCVSLVRPTAIDTPFPEHGLNRLPEGRPSLPKPIYHADVAAEAILKCAEAPQRDVYVGGPARLSAVIDTFFPKVKDMMAEAQMKKLKEGNKNRSHGHEKGHVSTWSLYTKLTTMGGKWRKARS